MALAAEDVVRAVRASWRLMARPDEAALDCSEEGLRGSYAALLLALPALICLLAAERVAIGLPNAAGLFDTPFLVVATATGHGLSLLAMPALLLALAPDLRHGPRLVAFAVAWNWSGLVSAYLLAVPATIFAIGWSNPGLATVHGLGFLAIVARLRYAAARSAFGSAPAAPAMIAVASLMLDYAVMRTLGLWGL